MGSVEIGAKLKRLRTEAGLTLVVLAERAKIDAGNLSRIENGKVTPSLETASRLAGALKKDPAELFGISEIREIARHDVERQQMRAILRVPELEAGTIELYDRAANRGNHDLTALAPECTLFEVVGFWPELRFETGDLLIVSAKTEPALGDTVLVEVSGEFLPFATEKLTLPGDKGHAYSYSPLSQNFVRGSRTEPMKLLGLIVELRRHCPRIMYK